MNIRYVDTMVRPLTKKMKIIGKFGTLNFIQNDSGEWDIEQLLDVPVSRYILIKETEEKDNGEFRENTFVKVYLREDEFPTEFYQMVRGRDKQAMKGVLNTIKKALD